MSLDASESFPVVASLLALILLSWLGVVVRERVALLQRWFIPGSLVAGVLGLAAGPEVAGRLTGTSGLVPEAIQSIWGVLPGMLISVVFAALFLGKELPTPRKIWRLAGPQVAFGQSMAWGQYVVGLLLALLVLGPVWDMPAVSGALIEISFEGGHGTSAGMAGAFDAAEFSQGGDLALGLATVGVIAAVIVGVIFVNWAVRTGRVDHEILVGDADPTDDPFRLDLGRTPIPSDDDAGHYGTALLMASAAIAISIVSGWLVLRAIQLLEQATWGSSVAVLEHVPLFPFAMIGGILVQVLLMRTGNTHALDRRMLAAVRGLSLDLLIAAAIATLSLAAIASDIVPFLLLATTGILWSLFALIVLAPRILPDWWVERAVTDLGQSLGMTATGLMLLRIADPASRSPVLSAFGYKQLLFEPVVGGGLFTAASVPLIAAVGGWPVLGFVSVMCGFWIVLGLRLFGGPQAHTGQSSGR